MTFYDKFSFCESVFAGSASPWHIRLLTKEGRKLGGGVTTESLCSHVKVRQGWDLALRLNKDAVSRPHVCSTCAQKFEELLSKETP